MLWERPVWKVRIARLRCISTTHKARCIQGVFRKNPLLDTTFCRKRDLVTVLANSWTCLDKIIILTLQNLRYNYVPVNRVTSDGVSQTLHKLLPLIQQ